MDTLVSRSRTDGRRGGLANERAHPVNHDGQLIQVADEIGHVRAGAPVRI